MFSFGTQVQGGGTPAAALCQYTAFYAFRDVERQTDRGFERIAQHMVCRVMLKAEIYLRNGGVENDKKCFVFSTNG